MKREKVCLYDEYKVIFYTEICTVAPLDKKTAKLDLHFISHFQVDKVPSEKIATSMADLRLLQHIVQRFQGIQIDSTEFACLKAIVLFKPGKFKIFS